jgi:hypothetical protein
VTTTLTLVLAACGGGGGGGGGGGAPAVFHVLIVNHTKTDASVTYSAGEPLPSADKPPVKSCTAKQIDYPLSDQFTLTVNGKVEVDTAQIQGGVPNQGQSDVQVQIDLNKDGSVDSSGVRVGSKMEKPAQLGICF